MIRTVFVVVMSYVCAAALSSHVSMDLRETNWFSLWTYFWWVVAMPVMAGVFALIGLAGFAIWRLFK